MKPEEIRDVLKRREEMWRTGNVEIIHELFSEDFVSHESDGDYRGLDFFKKKMRNMREPFSDLKMKYSQIVIQGDQAAYVWTLTGINENPYNGPFGPLEPTGDEVVLFGGLNSRFENGKIVEEWVHLDRMQFLEKLGGVDVSTISQEIGTEDSRRVDEEGGGVGQKYPPSR